MMTQFCIITTDSEGNVEHYVGEDVVLWDWLVADNYETAADGNLFRLTSPVGYEFHAGNLCPVEGYDGGRNSELIGLGSTKDDKALMLLISLRFVSPEEFSELDIDEERVLEIESYE